MKTAWPYIAKLFRTHTFRRVCHIGLPAHFVASPELHGRFKCCPEATAPVRSLVHAWPCSPPLQPLLPLPFPAPPLLVIFLCTSHISSLAFLPHLPLPPQIPISFPYCAVPILAPLLPRHGVQVPSTPPIALLEVLLGAHHSALFKEPKSTPIRQYWSSEYNLGTELILLSVHALDEFSDAARVTCNKRKNIVGFT
jgi:hypothetical protein